MIQGRLITNGVILERHEMSTVNFLLSCGDDIELIRPMLTPHSKNADLILEGLVWEMKTLTTGSKTSLTTTFRRATRQSSNVIMDLRWVRISEDVAICLLRILFDSSRHAKRLIIITREGRLIRW